MTDQSYLFEKKPFSWLSLLSKLFLIFIAFVLVMLTVLANMGGSNDMLKEGVEDFVSRTFAGRPAKVDTLVKMSFFPTVGLDVEGVNVLVNEDTFVPVFTAKKIKASMGFWDVASASPKIKELYVEDVKAIKGVFVPSEVTVEKVFIDHDEEQNTAALRGNGKIGLYKWDFFSGMQPYGRIGKAKYGVPEEFPFALSMADVSFETNVIKRGHAFLKLDDFVFSHQGHGVKGHLAFSALEDTLLKVTGSLETLSGESHFDLDLLVKFSEQKTGKISGKIRSDRLVLDEFFGDASVMMLVSRLREIMGYDHISSENRNKLAMLNDKDLDLVFELSNVLLREAETADMSFILQSKNGNLRVGGISTPDGAPLMPPILLLSHYPDPGQTGLIVQNGKVNGDFMGTVFGGYQESGQAGTYDVACGLGHASVSDDGYNVSLPINLHDAGAITAIGENISIHRLRDGIEWKKSQKQAVLRARSYDQKQYDFVMESLQSTATGSPCEAYIMKQDAEQGQAEQ